MSTLTPFSPTLPTFQTTWDSTSLGWLKSCPQLYRYQMIDQWSPKSKGIHLAFGGWYASGVELYARRRAEGLSHDEAVLAMVAWALEATGEFAKCPECIDETHDLPRLACHICGGHGTVWTPWDSADPIKNRYTLLRSLVWNVDDRNLGPWRTMILSNGKPAVELNFKFPAFEVAGHTIHLAGHLDEIVLNTTAPGQRWVKDDKTSKGQLDARYFSHFSPDNQMSLYTIAGKIITGEAMSGVLVRAAQIGVGFTRFATQPISRPPAVLAEWMEDTKWWIGQAHSMALANHWPKNDKHCNDFGGCPFQKVCSVSPSHRESWLQSDFVKREWNPLVERT